MKTVLWWHLHQPDYREPNGDSAGLPWVRMHALRAYTDLPALILDEGLAGMTINVVPSLADQLEDLAHGKRQDRYLRLAAAVAAGDDAAVHDAFRIHTAPTPIGPRALERFEDLRAMAHERRRPSLADAVDACVLFHLSWIGHVAASQPLVRALLDKRRGYTGAELDELLALSLRLCAEVLPRLKRAREQGLVHLTATPYFHPILPLVIDSACAREATWDKGAPPPFAWPEDARAHVALAVERHQALFGERPRTMWPGEGSLSEAALGIFAEEGVELVATDEAMLHKSRGHEHARTPPHLFAWRHEPTGVRLLFRDRRLSDDWGFVYRDHSPHDAIRGFVRGLEERRRMGGAVTAVILDGENPFERFSDAGHAHLAELARAARRGDVTFSSPLDAAADRARPLARLATGSWIDASFDIWAGDDEDRAAWRLLAEVRRRVENAGLPEPRRSHALRHVLAAEGSDWFWWFGPEFHAEERPTFDLLFRLHLAEALRDAGIDPQTVPELAVPVHRARGARPVVRALPLGVVDDDTSPHALWPWTHAVVARAESGQGTMHRGAPLLVELRALAGAEELFVLALCRDDVASVEVSAQGNGAAQRVDVPAKERDGARVARATLSFSSLMVEPGAAVAVRALAKGGEVTAALPEGDAPLVVVRPPRSSFEA